MVQEFAMNRPATISINPFSKEERLSSSPGSAVRGFIVENEAVARDVAVGTGGNGEVFDGVLGGFHGQASVFYLVR
jgi:hypothetical protein